MSRPHTQAGDGGTLQLLLASDDRDFLRFAGVVLGHDGHRFVRSTVDAVRLARLTRLHGTDVIVLDAREDAVLVARVCGTLLADGLRVGLVLVGDEAHGTLEVPVVARWGSPESLRAAVARAADTEPGPVPTPGLRLVHPSSG